MKQFIILPVFFLLSLHSSYAQKISIDSLKQIIDQHKEDTTKVNALAVLCNSFRFPDAINYGKQGHLLAQKINYKKGEADCNLVLSAVYGGNGFVTPCIQYALDALNIYEDLKDYTGIASAHLLLQGNYREAQEYNKALFHEFKGVQVAESKNIRGVFVFSGQRLAPLFHAEIGQTYILKNQLDSALIYVQKSIEQNELFNDSTWFFPVYLLATIQQMKGDYISSLENYRTTVGLAISNDKANDTFQIYSGMSTLFRNTGQLDSSIHYAQIVATSWNPQSETKNLLEAVTNLATVYKTKKEKDSAIKYTELTHFLKDSLLSVKNDREIQSIGFNEQLKQEKLASEQAKYKNRIQLYATIAGLFALLLITTILWKNYKRQQIAKIKIEKAYTELKSTQQQLIQSEKMASLGELTAGIAHEIQNPLNFVNNFSEVNKELIAEMKTEIEKGNLEEVKFIAEDIEANSEKINYHGKRADIIVKGMLQHSRRSSGVKEPTDINKLADEYLRLVYHGVRAKDKSFNVTMKTDFDENIDSINIIPQDIGRVLLNLYNNAFYAVNEKKKQQQDGFEPAVLISTKRIGNSIEIKVKDNGNGIPQKIVDKIFQPFFTTKPTGQGTGLGLSLAYDIVKTHGGEIKVETKEGECTEFVIQLPVSV